MVTLRRRRAAFRRTPAWPLAALLVLAAVVGFAWRSQLAGTDRPVGAGAPVSETALPEPAATALPEPAAAPPPAPAVAVRIEPATVGQGELAVVWVQNAPGPVEGMVVDGSPLRFFARDGEQAALLGVAASAAPGEQTVVVRWPGGEWRGQVEVVSRPFPEDRITVSETRAQTMIDPRADQEAARVRQLRSQGLPEPAWDGPFELPAEGRFSTEFGEIRYVNGTPRGQHSGLDIAAPEGAPVKAANRGQVVLAEYLVLTGNTVIIDHGGGLYTGYSHLSALAAEAGRDVQKGDLIGRVGSTGLATGPHLHWTATVGNTFINPRILIGTTPLGAP